MAQYNAGHIERISAIEQACGELPNLALAGNAYHGIGVPDCVRSGTEAANRILQSLGLPRPE
jgi:oxygen-dependent protoporphyrinogen oxidase